ATRPDAADGRSARAADRGIGGAAKGRAAECRSCEKARRAVRTKRRSRIRDQVVSAGDRAHRQQRRRSGSQNVGFTNARSRARDRRARRISGRPPEKRRDAREKNGRAPGGEKEARRNLDRRSQETSGTESDRSPTALRAGRAFFERATISRSGAGITTRATKSERAPQSDESARRLLPRAGDA